MPAGDRLHHQGAGSVQQTYTPTGNASLTVCGVVTSELAERTTQCAFYQLLMLVDFVLGPAREDLFLAPGGNIFERLAVDEIEERLFFTPLAGDQVRSVVAHVFPQRGTAMPFRGAQRANDGGKLLFKI